MIEIERLDKYHAEGREPIHTTPQIPDVGVRTLGEIRVGEIYFDMGLRRGPAGVPPQPYRAKIKVLEPPYRMENGQWWVKVEAHPDDPFGGRVTEISLADSGVVPYENGQWHKFNWLAGPIK